MKRLILLGSTGSIGCQCLDVVRCHPGQFEIVALATHRNQTTLLEQCREFHPRFVALTCQNAANQFSRNKLDGETEFFAGPESLVEIVRRCDADVAVIATVGAVGFRPTFEAIRTGKNIALANKEVLAMAGDLLMQTARDAGVSVVPIDSEHSAILQCLQSGRNHEVERIILTASGGPFRGKKPEEFEDVPVEAALKHPTWTMGAKITIDSATLFNKGLEVIEAHHLFNVPLDRIDVVVHPQSVIHSMVEFCDGSILAQLGDADMRTPIQYALSYPERIRRSGRKLNLLEISELTFFPPDIHSFPCLALAYDAARIGGTVPAFLSAANEELVGAYLDSRISFGSIPRLLQQSVKQHTPIRDYTLEDIQQADREARTVAQDLISQSLISDS